MAKFKSKPVEIDAIRYVGNNKREIFDFCKDHNNKIYLLDDEDTIQIRTLEGNMTVTIGDWIIKGVIGEFYPCKPDVFSKKYEPL